jgi:hypothetical protein
MLTDTAIRKAKPSAAAQKLTDGGGMYLLLKPDGSRYWRMDYRFSGKRKTLALGVYPIVTLADARQRREDAKRRLSNGIYPSAERKETKQAQVAASRASGATFAAVARDWMARQEVAEVTASKNRWILETFLFPEIGSLPLTDISSRVLLDALRKVEATGKLETAKRAKVKAGQVFRASGPAVFPSSRPLARVVLVLRCRSLRFSRIAHGEPPHEREHSECRTSPAWLFRRRNDRPRVPQHGRHSVE